MQGRGILVLGVVLALGVGLVSVTFRRAVSESRAVAGARARLPYEAPAARLAEPGARSEPPARERASREDPRAQTEARASGTAGLVVRVVARETGVPLGGVQLALERADGPWLVAGVASSRGSESRTSRTDANGVAELAVRAEASYTLQVRAPGEALFRREEVEVPALAAGEWRELLVEIATVYDLRWFARVVDDATAVPIGGASVAQIFGTPLRALGPSASGADGVLAFDCASWDESGVRIAGQGYAEAEVLLGRGHETPERARPVRLMRPARIEVSVRDGAGAPLSAVAVMLRCGAPDLEPGSSRVHRLPRPERRLSTNEQGACSFDGLLPRVAITVVVRSAGEPSQLQEVHLEPGETRALAFELGGGCSVLGLAQDERGMPLAALDLWRLASEHVPGYLEPEHESAVVDKARSDAQGRFVFDSVPAGEWWIGAAPYERNGGAIVPLATRVLIAPGERTHTLTLICPAARYIRGRVLTAAGRPAEASVSAAREDVDLHARSSNGRFVLGPLPEGEWRLQASPAEDAHDSQASELARAPSECVRAFAGQDDLILRLRSAGGLSGVVLDEAGRAVARAVVELSPEEDGLQRLAFCDEDGRFSFAALAPGAHTLFARSGAAVCVLGPECVEPGQERAGLELRLEPGARLRVRLRGAPNSWRAVRLSWNGAPLLRDGLQVGTEIEKALPAGSIRCELLSGASPAAGAIEQVKDAILRAGEEILLEFELDLAAR